MNHTQALMIQGTGSDVGKSLLLAGLCKAFSKRGLKVRPFKPQNMSNNAAVTKDGGEIGRAQALQALAAGVELTVHLNPVLLKPQSESGAQIVVQGKVEGTVQARDYHTLKPKLLKKVLESFVITANDADLVLVEGAGSPAEVNLRAGDIANMGFAEAANVPVVLVADIERGGVLANIVGTVNLLGQSERSLISGYIVNKFRGDVSLFDDAFPIIKKHTGLNSFGVVPFFCAANELPQEDTQSLGRQKTSVSKDAIKIYVLKLSRIANFDDLDPLAAESDVEISIINPGTVVPSDADLIIIPGSKSTLADLKQIRTEGWDVDIAAHHRRGGYVVGLCGGYQMLGCQISDPDGIEGDPSEANGLGLINISTVIRGNKILLETTGFEIDTGKPVKGYEMHIGKTSGPGLDKPWIRLEDGRNEGAVSNDGRVRGTYLHGVFSSDAFRHNFLAGLRPERGQGVAYEARIDLTLDRLAMHLEENLDLDGLLSIAKPINLTNSSKR
ncbi:MAG: cobyric acid synthase [Pseudomonadota bacterium]|nr:cobyric acid synthase [Pseudomonadota bacterium]